MNPKQLVRVTLLASGILALAWGVISIKTERGAQPSIPQPTSPQATSSGIKQTPLNRFGQQTSSKSSETEPEGWNIHDFDLLFDQGLVGFFPEMLPVYRLAFITDAGGTKTEVDEEDAATLAAKLGIQDAPRQVFFRDDTAKKHPHWFAGNGDPDELSYESGATSPRPSGAAIDIDALSGYFDYESRQTCERRAQISSQQAASLAQQFLSEHIIDLGATTSTVVRPAGHGGCYEVIFTNLLPVDSIEMVNRLIPDGERGLGGLESPLDYVGQSHFSVLVDAEDGDIVAIRSNFLRSIPVGNYPLQTLQELEATIHVPEDVSIPPDINPQPDPSIVVPRNNSGKIVAMVRRIYPVYVTSQNRAHQGFVGALLEPFYFALIEIQGAYVTGSTPMPLSDYAQIVQLRAILAE